MCYYDKLLLRQNDEIEVRADRLIYIFHSVTQLLTNYQYVTVVALDITKAFDTVRHSTLLEKITDIVMPDEVYNWLVSCFNGHRLHKIRYVIVSSSRNICWNNTGLWHRSGERCGQLQRFNGCQTRKFAVQIRR